MAKDALDILRTASLETGWTIYEQVLNLTDFINEYVDLDVFEEVLMGLVREEGAEREGEDG